MILLCVILNFLLTKQISGEFKLTILHTNDVHARVEQGSKISGRCTESDTAENKCYGGVARIKTEVEGLRSGNKNVLVLDGGDQFQGTTWFVVYNGNEAAHFMNRIGYDAMAVGNHDLDRGPAVLGNFIENVTFDVLSANMDVSKEPYLKDLVKKSVVIQRGGVNIGIIGYTTIDTPNMSSPGPNIVFKEEVDSIKSEAKRLTALGINIIIALGHSGFEKDQEIAKNVPEVDVVVGGHTHTFLYTGPAPSNEIPVGSYPFIVTQPSGKQVPVVQAYAYGKYLGFLQTIFDDKGNLISSYGNPILLNGSIQMDPAIETEVESWGVKVKEFGAKKVGVSYVLLNGEGANCVNKECNLGSFITDAMVKMALKTPIEGEWTKAAIAICHAGGLRASINKGEILRDDIIQTLPFRNTLVQTDLKGSDLKRFFEFSVEGTGYDAAKRFLQVSGVKVRYDLTKPRWNRVVSLEILCHQCEDPVFSPVNPEAIYPV